MTCFRGAKRVHNMATGKSDDELLQHDNKLRIWTRSGIFRKVENPERSMSWWQSTTRTPMTTSMLAWHSMTRKSMTTSMIAWHCTMRTPLTTSTKRERAFPLVCQRSVVSHHSHTHRGSSSRSLRLSPHPHVHGHLCVLFTLILLPISCSTLRPLSSSSCTWSLW